MPCTAVRFLLSLASPNSFVIRCGAEETALLLFLRSQRAAESDATGPAHSCCKVITREHLSREKAAETTKENWDRMPEFLKGYHDGKTTSSIDSKSINSNLSANSLSSHLVLPLWHTTRTSDQVRCRAEIILGSVSGWLLAVRLHLRVLTFNACWLQLSL